MDIPQKSENNVNDLYQPLYYLILQKQKNSEVLQNVIDVYN